MDFLRLVTMVLIAGLSLTAVACGGSKSDASKEGAVTESSGQGSNKSPESTTAVPSESANPSTSASLWQSAQYAPPVGEVGKLAVVSVGAPISSYSSTKVAVVVRNNTGDTVSQIEAAGTGRNAAGTLTGSGRSQGFTPAIVKPGEWAYGFVYFSVEVPSDTTVTVTATSSKVTSGSYSSTYVVLDVKEVVSNIVRTNIAVTGILSNPSTKQTVENAQVMVLCTAEDGTPLSVDTDYGDGPAAMGGGTTSFTADLYKLAGACPVMTVGAGGYGK